MTEEIGKEVTSPVVQTFCWFFIAADIPCHGKTNLHINPSLRTRVRVNSEQRILFSSASYISRVYDSSDVWIELLLKQANSHYLIPVQRE
jgi:hypothetical protein